MTAKTLCILGRGRSGSTILANVLGELPGFFAAGEVRVLWERLLTPRPECSCGNLLSQCPVWSPVLERLSDVNPAQALRLQRAVVSERRTLRLLRPAERGRWPELERYAALMDRVYQALAEATGCRVIVDSSKRPAYGAVLRHLTECEPYYLHLTRDPRASAASWRRRRYQGSTGAQVPQRGAVDATLRWDLLNLGSEAVLRAVGTARGRRLRYEDFAARPRSVVEQVCEFARESPESLPFSDDRTARLGVNHAVAGNPSRLTTGVVEVRDTAEWRDTQPIRDQWLATVIALPFLRRYGYPFRPGRAL